MVSKWNGQVILTDQITKDFEGLLGTIAVFYPQTEVKAQRGARKARKVTKAT